MQIYPITIPGGSDTQFQYNNGGIFGGVASATYNDSTGAIVFQPAADSTTFFQVLDADGGTPVLNVDSDNERVGYNTNAPSAQAHWVTDDGEILLGTGVFSGKSANTDTGIELSKSGQLRSGLFTEVNGEVLSYGINVPQIHGTNNRNQNQVGGIFRMDARSTEKNFTVIGYPTGGDTAYEYLQLILDTGRIILSDNNRLRGYLSHSDWGGIFYSPNGSVSCLFGGNTVGLRLDDGPAILYNKTHEDADGGRESQLNWWGEQSGGERSTLARIEASHDGAADDEKGELIFYTNDGNDGDSPTLRMSIDSTGATDVVGAFTAGTVRSDDGVSGTLELDDGTTEKITLVFTGGILTSRTIAATTGSVLANWTD